MPQATPTTTRSTTGFADIVELVKKMLKEHRGHDGLFTRDQANDELLDILQLASAAGFSNIVEFIHGKIGGRREGVLFSREDLDDPLLDILHLAMES